MKKKNIVDKIRHDLRRERFCRKKASTGRYIPKKIYEKLKAKTICEHCGKKKGNRRLQIHHKIAIKDGGTNDEGNLMAVHKACHKILDKQYDERRLRMRMSKMAS